MIPALWRALAEGTVVACRGDYYGRPVNLAARLEGVAKPSTVLVAEEVRRSLGRVAKPLNHAVRRRGHGECTRR